MCSNILYFLLMTCAFWQLSCQSRILGIIPSPFRSITNYMTVLFTELANRGHDVTVITSLPIQESKNISRVIQADSYEFFDMVEEGESIDDSQYFIEAQRVMWASIMKHVLLTINSTSVLDFIRDDHSHFDVVVSDEEFLHPYYMFAYKYKAPLVLVHAIGHAHYLNSAIGNPLELSYEGHHFLKYHGKMNLLDKTHNALCSLWDAIAAPYYFRHYDEVVEQIFKDLPKPLPKVHDIEKNASMVLVNSHFAIDSARPVVPTMVDIAGMHITEPKPLPKELQDIIENAKHGVIYFSLGSIVKSAELPREKVDIFLKIFSELKQTILWKWEDDTLEGKPNNVVIQKWMPQNDILSHKNVRLFISHGGLLSSQETMYHGVPIVGIPAFADHYKTMAKVRQLGVGEEMRLETLNYKDAKATIEKVMNDDIYRKNMKELSYRFKDRPNSAMDTAIYWIEYVIRHKGAHFLKPPSVWMPWYEYYMLDVTALLLSVLVLNFVNILIIYKLLRSLIRRILYVRSVKYSKKNE